MTYNKDYLYPTGIDQEIKAKYDAIDEAVKWKKQIEHTMSTKSPWILTDAQRENITVYQCTPLEDGPRAGFYWAYKVLVGGCTYQGRHPHPTRRAAWAAAKSLFKALSEKQGLRDSPIAEPQQQQ